MYIGLVKRYVTSKLLHIELKQQLQPIITSTVNEKIIKVYTSNNEQDMKRNRSYIMILKIQDGRYKLMARLPFEEHVLKFIKDQCNL